jgi:polyhydroxyalkanoate synthase
MTKPATENTWFIDSFQNAQHFAHVLENIFDPFGMASLPCTPSWPGCAILRSWLNPMPPGAKTVQFAALCRQTLPGVKGPEVELPHPEDTRFVEAEWSDTASFDIAKQWYLILTHHLQDMLYETPVSLHALPGRRRSGVVTG